MHGYTFFRPKLTNKMYKYRKYYQFFNFWIQKDNVNV